MRSPAQKRFGFCSTDLTDVMLFIANVWLPLINRVFVTFTLRDRLRDDEMLDDELISAAKRVTDQCYQVYVSTPRVRMISYSKTEEISITLDELGLLSPEYKELA